MTLRVGSRARAGELPFREVFDVWGYRYHRDGKGFQGAERTMCKGMGSWWRDKYIYRSKTVPMGGLQNKNSNKFTKKLEEDRSSAIDRENCEQNLDYCGVGRL